VSRSRWLAAVALVAWLAAGDPAPAQGPEDFLVVFNNTSALSRRIASYYRQKRQIPERNLCAIRTRTDEEVTRAVYLREVQEPVARCLDRLPPGLAMRYIAMIQGVTLKIGCTLSEKGTAAAVDSELALLYGKRRGEKYLVEGWVRNPYFAKIREPFDQERFPMYLVTRLAAYRFETVRRMIDDAVAARNRGKYVIDLRGGMEGDGEEWLLDAGIRLPKSRLLLETTTRVVTGEREVIWIRRLRVERPQAQDPPLGFSMAGRLVGHRVRFQRRPDVRGTAEGQGNRRVGRPVIWRRAPQRPPVTFTNRISASLPGRGSFCRRGTPGERWPKRSASPFRG
jgi:hypothetical protein